MAHGDLGNVRETKLAAKYCVGPLWDELHIDVRRAIACGKYGCVYKQRGSRNVVKIVAGEGAQMEREANVYLIDIANRGIYNPHLPKIYEVCDLGSCAMEHGNEAIMREGAFAFVREDLPDAPWDANPKIEDQMEAHWDAVTALFEATEYAHLAAQAEAAGLEEKAEEARIKAKQSFDFFEKQTEEFTANDRALFDEVRELFEWGFAHGIAFMDAHLENWGVRRATGELVLRDIGITASTDAGKRLTPAGHVPIRTLSGLVVMHGLKNFGGRSWRRAR